MAQPDENSGSLIAAKLLNIPDHKYDVICDPYLKDKLNDFSPEQQVTIISRLKLNDPDASIIRENNDGKLFSVFQGEHFAIKRSDGVLEYVQFNKNENGAVQVDVEKRIPPNIEIGTNISSGNIDIDKNISHGLENKESIIAFQGEAKNNLADVFETSRTIINPEGSGDQYKVFNHAYVSSEGKFNVDLNPINSSVEANIGAHAGFTGVKSTFDSPAIENNNIFQNTTNTEVELGLKEDYGGEFSPKNLGKSIEKLLTTSPSAGLNIGYKSETKTEKIEPFSDTPKDRLTFEEQINILSYGSEHPGAQVKLPITPEMIFNSTKEDFSAKGYQHDIEDAPKPNHSFLWDFETDLGKVAHSLGFEASTLKSLGMDPAQLSEAHYDFKDIKEAGYTAEQYEKAGLVDLGKEKYEADTLKEAAFLIAQLPENPTLIGDNQVKTLTNETQHNLSSADLEASVDAKTENGPNVENKDFGESSAADTGIETVAHPDEVKSAERMSATDAGTENIASNVEAKTSEETADADTETVADPVQSKIAEGAADADAGTENNADIVDPDNSEKSSSDEPEADNLESKTSGVPAIDDTEPDSFESETNSNADGEEYTPVEENEDEQEYAPDEENNDEQEYSPDEGNDDEQESGQDDDEELIRADGENETKYTSIDDPDEIEDTSTQNPNLGARDNFTSIPHSGSGGMISGEAN